MTDQPPVLLIEDTPSLRLMYESVLRRGGHAVRSAATAEEGMRAFAEVRPEVVVLDVMLPDRDGLDAIHDLLKGTPTPNVIVITAHGSIRKAVAAMRAGAHEFLVKPFDEQRFLSAVRNAIGARRRLPAQSDDGKGRDTPPGDFIGRSQPMRDVYSRIRSVARSMATVFITGESGTGKELCAQAIHDQSDRAGGPLIALNCGAIPSELLESEVFGHIKGSFTGAIADKKGAAAAADGGTLFLDEICEMDMALQTKLLRFLQTSTIQPVGAARPHKVNVRIVCATNRDPLDAVRQGSLREDLYYRLHVVPIHMPPLRERGEDVVEIAGTELMRLADEEGRSFDGLSDEVATLFRAHPWPGNVRQLLNVLRNVVVLNEGGEVTLDMLPPDMRQHLGLDEAKDGDGANGSADAPVAAADLVGRPLAEVERLVIERTIERCGGSVPRAARALDVAPSTIYRKRDSWLRHAPAAE